MRLICFSGSSTGWIDRWIDIYIWLVLTDYAMVERMKSEKKKTKIDRRRLDNEEFARSLDDWIH